MGFKAGYEGAKRVRGCKDGYERAKRMWVGVKRLRGCNQGKRLQRWYKGAEQTREQIGGKIQKG